MLGQALRLEYEKTLQQRCLARDSRGTVYLLTPDSQARGRSSLKLRMSRVRNPRSLDDFSAPTAIGPRAPRRAGDELFAAGMVIDRRDRMHIVENTAAGESCCWTADLPAGKHRTAVRRSGVTEIATGSRLGDLQLAADDTVWLSWISLAGEGHAAAVHMGAWRDGRWRSWLLATAHGICPPSLMIRADGSFYLAWHDIGENLYCLQGMLREVGHRKRWQPRKVIGRARRPAMADLRGRAGAVYENDGAALDFVALDASGGDRDFLTWPDERFIGHTCHSPQFAVDGYGVAWLFFIDATRRCLFCSRWLGTGWGPIQRGPAMHRNAPRFEDNHLRLDRFAIESHQAEHTAGMVLAITHDGPPPNVRISPLDVPVLAADAGTQVLFLDLREIQVMDGLRLRLDAARKSSANPILRRRERGPDANGVGYPSVLREDGRYRMWYCGTRVDHQKPWWTWSSLGYAESQDGLHFVRKNPRTGPPESRRGRRSAQILPYACQIFRDADEPNPDHRYKLLEFANSGVHMERVRQGEADPWIDQVQGWLHTSPDGCRWSRRPTSLQFPNGRPFSFVPQCLFRDPSARDERRRFKAYGFVSLNVGRRGGAYAYSPDAIHWTYCANNPVLDPFARCIPVVRGGKFHQIHDSLVWPQAGYFLALYQYQHSSDAQDVELAASRDGEHFVHVCPGQKVLSLGVPEAWDSAQIFAAHPVFDNDRVRLYYGAVGRHVSHVTRTGTDLNEADVPRGIGVADLRLDGYTHLEPEPGRESGVLTTIPVRGGGAVGLSINTRCRGGSSVAVELLDAGDNRPLPGYARTDAHPIRGDHMAASVRWKGRRTLPESEGWFRLRFHLDGPHARLYSFRFA